MLDVVVWKNKHLRMLCWPGGGWEGGGGRRGQGLMERGGSGGVYMHVHECGEGGGMEGGSVGDIYCVHDMWYE